MRRCATSPPVQLSAVATVKPATARRRPTTSSIVSPRKAKTRRLGVPAALIEAHGAVSAEVAEAMARGVKERAGVDFGLAVTGVAGPGGGTEEKPVGLVYIALADDAHTEHRRLMLPGDRHLIRWRSSQAALDLLRRRLI